MRNKKIKLTEEQFKEVIGCTLDLLQMKKDQMLINDIFSKCLQNAIICEGLIKSYSINDVEKVVRNMDIAKYKISFANTRFFLYKNKDGEIPYQIYMAFPPYMENIPKEYFENVIKTIETCGWYYATSLTEVKIKELNYEALKKIPRRFTLVFEPKFDVLLSQDEIPDKLYHITKSSLLDKIKRNGLVPKSNGMFTNHPERVYLFIEKPNLASVSATFKYGKGHSDDEEYCLLEIDGNKLNKSNKIYIDPNSNAVMACFTLEPIPPYAMTVLEKL